MGQTAEKLLELLEQYGGDEKQILRENRELEYFYALSDMREEPAGVVSFRGRRYSSPDRFRFRGHDRAFRGPGEGGDGAGRGRDGSGGEPEAPRRPGQYKLCKLHGEGVRGEGGGQ